MSYEEIWNNIDNRYNELCETKICEYTDVIKEYISKSVAESMITMNSNCMCCARHQINRPNNIDEMEQRRAVTQIQSRYYNTCMCSCRHHSRWLQKVFGEHEKLYTKKIKINN